MMPATLISTLVMRARAGLEVQNRQRGCYWELQRAHLDVRCHSMAICRHPKVEPLKRNSVSSEQDEAQDVDE